MINNVKCATSVKFRNMKKIIFNNLFALSFLIAFSFALPSHAQEAAEKASVISGILVDDSGLPLSGTVLSSSLEAVVTNRGGEFTIKVSDTRDDQIVIYEEGYQLKVIDVYDGFAPDDEFVMKKHKPIDQDRVVALPFQDFQSYRSVAASNVIYGYELASHPTTTVLEALAGRVPGLVVSKNENQPGFEAVGVSIRGRGALTYVDGILRDVSDLVVDEVEKIEVIKDFSGRAVLGIVAGNPIINITTKEGQSHKTAVSVNADLGLRNATVLPSYLDAYNYATLFNEARKNDGRNPHYTEERINGYRDGTNPLRYPNIDYYDRFVKKTTPFRSVGVNASGGSGRVRYFSLLNYVGTGGLEAVGQESGLDRFKLRANIDLQFTDIISMNVNLSGTYGEASYPNEGSGATRYNMFGNVLSRYPSNAHAMEHDGMLLMSDNYPINLKNDLMYSGFAKIVDLNTQNSTTLKFDLDNMVKGLSFYGRVAFDMNNSITNNKGGTEALYRHTIVDGEDNFQRMREKEVVTTLSSGADYFLRRTTLNGVIDYNRQFNNNELTLNAIYVQMLEDVKVQTSSYQPRKTQDISLRANYAHDKKYVLQGELNYSGIMKLPPGKRFNLFPTVGAGWVMSNEAFLKDNQVIDYLKLFTTIGIMGIDNFNITGYDQFYLHQTLWRNAGSWRPGIQGNYADYVNVYEILQQGSDDYKIPKRNHLNIGLEGLFIDEALSATLNYFHIKDYDMISLMESRVPALFGTGGFLPATNYGKQTRWGVEGALQYSKKMGDFYLSLGANAQYMRGKNIDVDEPLALDEHRKLAGKDIDMIWGYETDGLFQSDADVNAYTVTTSWGSIKPGDIKYVDYNRDGVIDAKDVHTLDAHYPRINYGVNLSLSYKRFKLFMVGRGVADGKTMLSNPSYFWISSETQNFSEPMLDRWPVTNNYPRLTTSSPHNYQGSSFWLRNASYFCLSNLELSYTLPRETSLGMLMKDTSFFVRGTNLFYLSSVNSYGLNPENHNLGIQSYPQMRTITLGVSLKF
mgnify:CR=1 FL=1|jgi:TonB-linked SusC/RagA family outer membrane protein